MRSARAWPSLVLGAFLALAGRAQAGGEVGDGTRWTGGGGDETVTVNVTQHSSANSASVTFTDSNGTSPAASGTLGPNSSEENPTATESGEGRTPGAEGETYRVKEGKPQRKGSDGVWRNMKPWKKKGTQGGSLYESLVAGQPAPRDGVLRASGMDDLPIKQGVPAPWAGVLGPGEEVTSLPQ